MPTKSEYGLGPLYHATPSRSATAILSEGITSIPVWLAYDRRDAYRSALDNINYAGSVVVFAVNLPSKWELERAAMGEYLSWKAIPARYVKRIN